MTILIGIVNLKFKVEEYFSRLEAAPTAGSLSHKLPLPQEGSMTSGGSGILPRNSSLRKMVGCKNVLSKQTARDIKICVLQEQIILCKGEKQ